MTKENTKKKKININKVQISPLKKLIGYPRNNTIKKISPKRRILKLLKENSLKKIREGKSQENTLITDKSISIPKNHSNIKRKNHKRNAFSRYFQNY